MVRTRSKGRLRLALFLAVGFAATGLALVNYGVHLFAGGSGWDVFGGADLSWLFGIGVSGLVYLALSKLVTSPSSIVASSAGR